MTTTKIIADAAANAAERPALLGCHNPKVLLEELTHHSEWFKQRKPSQFINRMHTAEIALLLICSSHLRQLLLLDSPGSLNAFDEAIERVKNRLAELESGTAATPLKNSLILMSQSARGEA